MQIERKASRAIDEMQRAAREAGKRAPLGLEPQDDNSAKAAETVRNALAWVRNNPTAWEYMTALALGEAAKTGHVSVAWLVEQVRRKDFATLDGSGFKVANRYRTVFARVLIKEHPELKGAINLSASPIDKFI